MNTQELIAYVEGYTLDCEKSRLRGESLRDTIRPINDYIEDLISKKDWVAINDMFDLVSPEKIQPIFSRSFLRLPFRVKESTPKWYNLRDRVVEDHKRRGLDVKRKLAGLLYCRYEPEYLVKELLHTAAHDKVSIFLELVMHRVETHFYYRDLEGLDAFLSTFTQQMDKFHIPWVISVLRASSRARTELKEWTPLRDVLVVRCEKEGIAYTNPMRGLLAK